MFGSKKDPKLEGPYKVDTTITNKALEKLLNQRHGEGYDLVTILQQQITGSSSGRVVVFRMRS